MLLHPNARRETRSVARRDEEARNAEEGVVDPLLGDEIAEAEADAFDEMEIVPLHAERAPPALAARSSPISARESPRRLSALLCVLCSLREFRAV